MLVVGSGGRLGFGVIFSLIWSFALLPADDLTPRRHQNRSEKHRERKMAYRPCPESIRRPGATTTAGPIAPRVRSADDYWIDKPRLSTPSHFRMIDHRGGRSVLETVLPGRPRPFGRRWVAVSRE